MRDIVNDPLSVSVTEASQVEPRDVQIQAFFRPWLPENAELTHPPKAGQIGTDLIYTNRLSQGDKVCLIRSV